MVEEKLIQIPLTVPLTINTSTGVADTIAIYDGSETGKMVKITNLSLYTNTKNLVYQVKIGGVLFPAVAVTLAASSKQNVLSEILQKMADIDTCNNYSIIIEGSMTVDLYITSVHTPHDATLLFNALIEETA